MIMDILWHELEANRYQLDYYAITICKGEIVKKKAYYLLPKEEQNQRIGQFGLDYLIDNGMLRCFSVGVDNTDSAMKYDFHLQTDFCELAYDVFSDGIEFFEVDKVNKVASIIANNQLSWVNRIVGCRIKENNLQNICIYFSCIDEEEYSQVQNVIEKIFCELSMNINNATVFTGENSWLHLVALDFFSDFYKIKLYFKFKKEYNVQQILKKFKDTNNYGAVQKIVESNAFIEGIQVSITKNQKVSYCFYLKKKD